MNSIRSLFSSTGLLALNLGLGLLFLGCGKSEETSRPKSESTNLSVQIQGDQLKQATDFVFSEDRFEPEAFNTDVSRSLNQWINSKTHTVDWSLDPLVNTWSEEVRLAADLASIESLNFLPRDAQYLQLSAWTDSLTKWLAEQPQRVADFRYLLYPTIQGLSPEELQDLRNAEKPVSALLAKSNPDLNEEQINQLTLTWQLFDWTVRNLQLEELASPPSADEVQLFALNRSDYDIPAAMGVPGPGYTRHPDQTMKVGRGDSWERGRVFLAMMRSLDMPAAWVAYRPLSPEGAPLIPRLLVVVIGNQGFLFDPALGIPVPSIDHGGIATIQEAAKNAKVFTNLDVADFELSGRNRSAIAYPIREWFEDDLTLVLDASPTSISKRMKLMEQSLTGTRRMRLYQNATEKAQQLQKVTGIENVILWDVPVFVDHYRKSFDQAVRFQNPRVAQLYFAEQIYDMPCPIKTVLKFRNEQETFEQLQYEFIRLRTARHRAIIGMFDAATRNDPEGAKQLLLTMRMSDEEIEALETDDRIRAAFGVEQAGPDSQEESTENIIKQTLKSVRALAALWLGIAHFEVGDPGSAMKWFNQVETFDEDETWVNLALYSRARANEATLKYEDAIRSLQASRSPQAAGDAIRARYLQAIVDKQNASQSAPAPTEETGEN